MQRNVQGDDTRPVYIAGPMRGRPLYNFPAFMRAEARLRDAGFLIVMNPAARDLRRGFNPALSLEANHFDLRDAFGFDLDWIARHAEAIYLLDGWEDSKGAAAERATALALGIDVLYEVRPPAWLEARHSDEYKMGYKYGYEDGTADQQRTEP